MNNISLSELTLDNIGDWPTPVKYALSGVISLILVAAGYWFFVKPNFERYDALVREERNLRTEFEKKQQQSANLVEYRNQLKILESRFGQMLAQLPAEHEMPGLLEDISNTGKASGLSFELFSPQPEIEHEFYVEMPIKISVVGTYHQMAVFLSWVAQMSRIVTLHDFEIVHKKDSKDSDLEMLQMNITAKIYRYKSI